MLVVEKTTICIPSICVRRWPVGFSKACLDFSDLLQISLKIQHPGPALWRLFVATKFVQGTRVADLWFSGTNMRTWKRCWAMWPAAGKCSNDGWNGSRTSKHGIRTSISNSDIRKSTERGIYTKNISLAGLNLLVAWPARFCRHSYHRLHISFAGLHGSPEPSPESFQWGAFYSQNSTYI